jgi:hypothetical protein
MQTIAKIQDFEKIIPLDTLVHLGAGQCIELDNYLSLEARQVLLVEADSRWTQDLRDRTKNIDHIQVIEATVAGSIGPATLYCYNLPEVNSIHPPSGLMDLFPGLKVVKQQDVETISPVDLLQPIEISSDRSNLLIIDLPGEELPVLQSLQQAKQLHLFSHIVLYCGREPLYEGSETADLILEWLVKEGFDLVAEDNSRDPDRPTWYFHRNPIHVQNREFLAQIEQLTSDKSRLTLHESDLLLQVQKLAQDRKMHTTLIAEHNTLINDLTKLLNKQREEIDQLTNALDAQTIISTERQTQIQQFITTQSELNNICEGQKSKIDTLEILLCQSKDFSTQLEAQLSEVQTHQQVLNNELVKVKTLVKDKQLQLEEAITTHDSQAVTIMNSQEIIKQLVVNRDQQKEINDNQNTEIDRLKILLSKTKNRASQLEAQLPEMETRQQLLNEELSKAEGQIDLIKDLLLRDQDI